MGWDNQAITQLVVNAASVGSGVFVYSGAPAFNNLVAAITGDGVQTDQYGNVYAGILDIGGFLTVNVNGEIFQFNGDGAQISFLSGLAGVFILYKNTGSAVQGGIAFAFATATYTDAFGNTIDAGFSMGEQAPPGVTGYGMMYTADGTGGSTAGCLYYLSPAGNYFNLAGP